MLTSKNENCLVQMEINHGAAIVSLNAPPANVLSTPLIMELSKILGKLSEADVSALIISGHEDYFSAGANIQEIAANSMEANAQYFSEIYKVFELVENIEVPVIAAVNGFAMGAGFELALCADIRVVDERAELAATGVNLGLVFCTQRLPRLIAYGPSKEMLLTGRRVSALEAQRLGIASYISAPARALEKAMYLAETIGQKSPLAVETVKQVINEGMNRTLREGLKAEFKYLNKMFASEDLHQRTAAFLEKKHDK